ncbi:MAG TPA: nuclear transport factor 2 family protein [Tepidisphaeraceae bacterium]|nr:nuclear transport factor 2 family protein [Tepidisphaeraceae bacterium]
MKNEPTPIQADQKFFKALTQGNADMLLDLLSDDFRLVDVISGSVTDKNAFVAVIESGQLKFSSIETAEQHVRKFDQTAVVIGRTKMKGHFGELPFIIASRYTHVFIKAGKDWKLVNAQGTQIVENSMVN